MLQCDVHVYSMHYSPFIILLSHFLFISYRLINQGLRPKRSYSVPATPIGSHTRPKYIHSISIGGGSTGKGGTGATPPAHSNIRVTRSMSKHQQGKREDEEMDETTTDCCKCVGVIHMYCNYTELGSIHYY